MDIPSTLALDCGLLCKYFGQFSKEEFAYLTPMLPNFTNANSILKLRSIHREGKYYLSRDLY